MIKLINHKIISIEIDMNQQHYIRFTTDKGVYCYSAEGDCCSESWFYEITGVDALLNEVIFEVDIISMGIANILNSYIY